MNCYITHRCINPAANVSDMEWIAEVVTEQDYHERGPHAHSHRTDPHPCVSLARESAQNWAEENGYAVTTIDAIAD